MNYVFGYGRVSTKAQVKLSPRDDDSLDVQSRLCKEWYEKEVQHGRLADTQYHAFYSDPDVSASKRLFERPSGKLLHTHVKHGDWIIASSLDRLFRDTIDGLESCDYFSRIGAKLYTLDFGCHNVSTPQGRLIFSLITANAEYQRRETARKTQVFLKDRSDRDLPYGNTRPIGWKKVKRLECGRVVTTLAPFEEERDVGRLVCRWAESGMSQRLIILRLMKEGIRRFTPKKGHWFWRDLIRLMHATKAGFPQQAIGEHGSYWRVKERFLDENSPAHELRALWQKRRDDALQDRSLPDLSQQPHESVPA